LEISEESKWFVQLAQSLTVLARVEKAECNYDKAQQNILRARELNKELHHYWIHCSSMKLKKIWDWI
jgi:hypothetical protein